MGFKLFGYSCIGVLVLSGLLYVSYKQITHLHEQISHTRAENQILTNTIKHVKDEIQSQSDKLNILNGNLRNVRKETGHLDKVLSKIDLLELGHSDSEQLKYNINDATQRLLKELEAI